MTEQPAAEPEKPAEQTPEDKPAENKPAENKPAEPGWILRRAMRTASSEGWEIVTHEDGRVGVVSLTYGDAVEGVLVLPEGATPEQVRGVLGWVTDTLMLDTAAGPGGVIHWVASVGKVEEFWRRSPGRKLTGAEEDLGSATARVQSVLHQMFSEVVEVPDGGGYAVDTGSARVFVQVRLVDTAVMVRVFSITNVDVPTEDGLAPYLLSLNHTLALGRFSLDPSGRSVWCDHVLTADELDDATIARAISAVASTADQYDDDIKGRFGGRTFREEGSPVEHVTGGEMAGGYL